MAGENVEILIRARNEANSAIAQAIGQLKVLEGQGVRAGAAPRLQLVRLTDALSAVSPQAARVTGEISRFASLGPLIGGVGIAVTGVAAAFAATLAAAKKFSSEVERLGNLSAATGASIENLQVLGEVFKRAGLGADSADQAMLRLNKSIAEQNPLLAKLGVTSRDPVEALLQLSRAFAASTDQAAKTKIAFELMGRGSGDVLKVIDALALKFPELRAEMLATGQAFTNEGIQAGEKFDAAWDKFTGRWQGFMQRIGGAAAMGANAIIDAFAPTKDLSPLERQLANAQQQLATFQRDASKFGISDPGKLAQLQGEVARLTRELAQARDVAREFERELPLFGSEGEAAVGKVAAAMTVFDKETKKAKQSVELIGPPVDGLTQALIDLHEAVGFTSGVTGDRRGVGPLPIPVGNPVEQLATAFLPADEAMADFRKSLDDLGNASLAGVDVIAGAFSGLTSGLTAAFQGLVAGTLSLKSAIVGVVRSMVSEILAALARLAAARLFTLLLKLTGLGAPAGMAIDSAVGAGAGSLFASAGGTLAPTFSAGGGGEIIDRLDQVVRGMEKLVRAPVTVNVTSLDAKSVEQLFNSPTGAARLAEIAASRGRSF